MGIPWWSSGYDSALSQLRDFDPCSRNQDPTGQAVLSEGKKNPKNGDFQIYIPEFSSLVSEMVKKKKKSACNAGEDLGLIPRLGRSSGGGNGNPFQYS